MALRPNWRQAKYELRGSRATIVANNCKILLFQNKYSFVTSLDLC